MLIKRIAIFGGTGFVGHSLCNHLSQQGYSLKVFTRNREYHRSDLILLPNLDLVEGNIYDPQVLKQQLSGCDAVINLVGILNEKQHDGSGFERAHVNLVKHLIEACEHNQISRFLQLSALNADPKGASYYLQSKGKAEELLLAADHLKVTIFRPSVIFGRRDSFFNRFAQLLSITPWIFPLACHNLTIAPISVNNVVAMMAAALVDPMSYQKCFEICGPRSYSLYELVKYTAKCIHKPCWIIPLNNYLSKLQAKILDYVPGKPFSTDNYLSAQTDSVCKKNDLSEYNIQPESIESKVPYYLNIKMSHDEFQKTARRHQ